MLGISIGSPANELIKPLNARMPAIITEADLKKWIGEEPVSKQDLKRMLQPFAASQMRLWPVSERVGNWRNNGADLVEPVSEFDLDGIPSSRGRLFEMPVV